MTVEISETRDITTCLALRRTVFIEEQGVSEADEIDEFDDDALHLLAMNNGKPIGGVTRATLGAQTHALGFYEKLGFTAYSAVFDDAGIDHQAMEIAV
jgi:predicted GNAT family N-acyltransferase